jgi:hypothetical protein
MKVGRPALNVGAPIGWGTLDERKVEEGGSLLVQVHSWLSLCFMAAVAPSQAPHHGDSALPQGHSNGASRAWTVTSEIRSPNKYVLL